MFFVKKSQGGNANMGVLSYLFNMVKYFRVGGKILQTFPQARFDIAVEFTSLFFFYSARHP